MARGKGEGTIYQRPSDGLWIAQATIDGKRKTVSGKTAKEAQTKLRELLSNADKGILPPKEQLTVGQFIERWLEDTKKPAVKPRTYQHYREMVHYYIIPNLGRVKLDKLQPAHLQRLYNQLLEQGLSPQTVHHVHAVIHNALKQALQWGNVLRNVSTAVQAPRVKRAEIEYLDKEQVSTLLTSIRGSRWEPLVTLALASGLRQGELLGLKWADVDLTANRLQVRRQLNRDGSLTETKTSKARRTVSLPSNATAVLREHKVRQNEQRLLVGSDWHANDLVFCTHQGKPLGQRNVLREFTLLLDRAGLRHVSFHALRHTHATLALLQGVPAKVVQERLGHSTISMTLDTYSHVIPSMDVDAAARLDAMFA